MTWPIAYEYSGSVRDAMLAIGVVAVSCDLTEIKTQLGSFVSQRASAAANPVPACYPDNRSGGNYPGGFGRLGLFMRHGMTINSRNKGASFERLIAIELELLTGIGFARDLEQYRAADHGDLVCDSPAWPFVIECKRYSDGRRCKEEWQAQASKAAKAVGKLPCVVFRFDRDETRVSVPWAAISVAYGGERHPDLWIETTIEGLAFLAAEIMAVAAVEKQRHKEQNCERRMG